MSIIKAIDNFNTSNWVVTTEELHHRYADLCIGFTKEAPVIEFSNLKFGYSFSENGTVLKEGVFPPEGSVYVRSDQEVIVTERINYEPNKTYSLFLWCENAGMRFENTFDIISPSAPQIEVTE